MNWADKNSEYVAASLATEGLIHCSNHDQIARVANQFYADAQDLSVMTILADRLTSPLRDEAPGIGECFPHVYGPINIDAIEEVDCMVRGADGKWLAFRHPLDK